ncbi:MAG: type II secretion system F family protein [Burkholderiaceae bacterium]|nr:type II secretion system F family protein [Burkholderiaceae bacterium]
MPEFLAQLFEPPRGVRHVRVQAADAQAVAQALGVAPQRVLGVRALDAAAPAGGRRRAGARLDLRLFSQELAVLLEAGIALPEALQTLRERDLAADRSGQSGAALETVLAALHQGRSISQALGAAPQAFDALFIALVAASERSGQLAATLRDHAAYLAWSGALAARLRAALVYPALLLGAGLLVVLFLLLYVLPRFAGVFDSLGRDIPTASRWLIELGVAAAAHPDRVAAGLLAPPLLALLAWRWPALRQALATGLARALWASPGLGPRLRLVALARLYRSLALLLGAGVPVPQALALTAAVLPAPLRAAAATTQAAVREGQRLSQAMDGAGLATPVARRMLRVGESSGQLGAMLGRAAAFHDDEIARSAELLTRTVNPLLMLVLGTLIGGIVVLMYLPIFTLMEQVQ